MALHALSQGGRRFRAHASQLQLIMRPEMVGLVQCVKVTSLCLVLSEDKRS